MNTYLKSLLRLLTLPLLLTSTGSVAQTEVIPEQSDGESAIHFGVDTVHYSVLNTRFLSPQVARSYGITRGDDKFLINIAVQHQTETGLLPIRAKVEGSTSDLIHITPLVFREVIEQQAVYYIAEFDISGEERRSFKIRVTTDTRREPYDIEFNKILYPSEDGL